METSPASSSTTADIGLLAPLISAIGELRERDLDWRAPAELTQILDATSRVQSQLDSLTAMAVVSGTRAGVHKQQRYDYQHCCTAWVNANDPDGEIPREQSAKTYFRASKHADGSVKLDGYLDPLTGAAFMTALNQETEKLFRAKQHDDQPRQLDLGRQGADALMNLIIRGHKNPDGTETTPLINIVMSLSVATNLLERLTRPSTHTPEPFPVSFDDIDGRCELIDGTPLHPHYAMQAMATAEFQRISWTPRAVSSTAR